jgi:hypothetical protein
MGDRAGEHTETRPEPVQQVTRGMSQRDLVIRSLILCPERPSKPADS